MTEENYPSKNLLESLPPDQLANLSSILEPRSFPAGTRLMEEGEQGDGCYFIDSGKVRVELEKNRENGPLLLGFIPPGGVVGEMNLMGMTTRSASVYAETDVTLRWLSLENFTSLQNSNPELQSSLISIFSEDITRKVRSTEKSLSEQKNSTGAASKSDANPSDSISEAERQFIANGRYALDRLLGKGGAGAVYLAYDTKLDRWVAIKRMPSTDSTISGEAKLMASFQHTNIVAMHDILQEGDETIFVMELVLGQTLEDLAEPLTEDTFRNLASQCLEGLSAAHEKNIVHRDIKPSNIMLAAQQDGQYCVKILDFGQSRTMEAPSLQTMDHSGAVVGSIYMMSPEQLSHEALDFRTDLYSLGCVFYQALTLQRPFSGSSFPEVIAAHLQHQFKPLRDLRPDLPKSLTDWVEKLFSLDRQDRPANSQTALEDLKSTTAPAKVHIVSSSSKNIAVVPAPVLKPVSIVQIPLEPIAVVSVVPALSGISTPTVVKPATSAVFSPIVTAVPASFAPVRVEPIAQPVLVAQEEQLLEPEPVVAQVYVEPIAEAVPVVVATPSPVVAPVRIHPASVAVSKPLSTQQNKFLPRIHQPSHEESSNWNSPPASKISLTKVGIAIAAAVVLLAAGGITGFMMFGSKLPPGFEPLLKQDLSNMQRNPEAWSLDGDTLEYSGKGESCWTKKEYRNFEMNFEIQLSKGGNSGVFFRVKKLDQMDPANLELELIDGNDAGWLIRQQRPKQPIAIADGNWHRLSILAKDNSITVSHDGKELYTANLTDPKLNKEGHIGFQGFVGTVKFRNIGIKEL